MVACADASYLSLLQKKGTSFLTNSHVLPALKTGRSRASLRVRLRGRAEDYARVHALGSARAMCPFRNH